MSIQQIVPLIMNPTAGGGRLLAQRLELEAAARQCDMSIAWWLTESPGHGVELGRRAGAEGHPLVFAFGGDGTYNEVAEGLLGSASALGVLPGGTTSVLAYELGIPRPASEALIALSAGEDRSMRVGRLHDGGVFLLMLSAGPDTLVLDRLKPSLKKLGGKVGVGVQAVLELLRWRELPRVRLLAAGQELHCGWVIVGNARCYAGPFHATPAADPFVPGFHVVAQQRNGRWPAICFALGLPFGRHVRRRDVVTLHADELQLLPLDDQVAYQIDGDVAGKLPVTVSVDPEELVVRIPAG